MIKYIIQNEEDVLKKKNQIKDRAWNNTDFPQNYIIYQIRIIFLLLIRKSRKKRRMKAPKRNSEDKIFRP